jgi:hypothetical protein
MTQGMSSKSSLDFDDLARELNSWAEAGRVAQFWWRDDDAIESTAALSRLLDLSDSHGIEVAVAVVPASASTRLPDVIGPRKFAAVLQHGYAHKNHAPPGKPAVECGGERPVDAVIGELSQGRQRLEELFGARAEPILAAPWNRIESSVLARLGDAGFRGASAYGPRRAMQGGNSLVVANAHVDPINWRERRFAGEGKALSGILGELRTRREGATDADEPVGLLTHHLDHDAGLWKFLDELFRATTRHAAARWIDVAEAFAAPPVPPVEPLVQ